MVGVVIGRFQVPSLTLGHRELIQQVIDRHGPEKTLVLVGFTAGLPCLYHPMPASTRVAMIRQAFPLVSVLPLSDRPTDALWSEGVDKAIHLAFPGEEAVLYCGRMSFRSHYQGKHQTYSLVSTPCQEGREVRASLLPINDSEEFRKGVIYAQKLRMPIVYQAVDVVLWQKEFISPEIGFALGLKPKRWILLGQKPGEEKYWRFPGGFLEPKDKSLEEAAYRELHEEVTGVTTVPYPEFMYAGSFQIPDWRYRTSQDEVMTSLFTAQFLWGGPRAGDDLARVKWFELDEVEKVIDPVHYPMAQSLKTRGELAKHYSANG